MSKRLVTLFLACLIVFGIVISVINFTSDDTEAWAEYGSTTKLTIAGVTVFDECMGDARDCCNVYPDE